MYVCVRGMMDVVFVCSVMRGAVGARVWEVRVFCHAYLYVCVHHVAVLNTEFCIRNESVS